MSISAPSDLSADPVTLLFPDLIWPRSSIRADLGTSRKQNSNILLQANIWSRESLECTETNNTDTVREIYISAATNWREKTRARRKLQIRSLSSQERGTLRWQRTMEAACQDYIWSVDHISPFSPFHLLFILHDSDVLIEMTWWHLELFREMKSFFNLSWGSPESVW